VDGINEKWKAEINEIFWRRAVIRKRVGYALIFHLLFAVTFGLRKPVPSD
jgi:hypothetical protein